MSLTNPKIREREMKNEIVKTERKICILRDYRINIIS